MKVIELFEKTSTSYEETMAAIKKLQQDQKFSSYDMSDFKVQADGSVNYVGNLLIVNNELIDEDEGCLPFPINKSNSVIIKGTNFKSFKNFPKYIKASKSYDFAITTSMDFNYKQIKTLNGMDEISVEGDVKLYDFDGISLHNVQKYLKTVVGTLTLPHMYEGPILSVLKINELKAINAEYSKNERLNEVCEIVNHYIQTSGNVGACQTDLFKSGFKEYATL
jgi:hypothetical protein